MTFNGLNNKNKWKKKATSNIKIQQVLGSIGLHNVGTYLGYGQFSSDIGLVNLHPSKGTLGVSYIHEKYFDSYGCVCPKNLSKPFSKRIGHCLYS